eukprot:gene5528-11137_t
MVKILLLISSLSLCKGFVHPNRQIVSTKYLIKDDGLASICIYKSRNAGDKKLFANLGKMYTRASYEEQKAGLVLDDFEHLLDAIRIFQKEYGDTDIPIKFEVPAQDPWSSQLHGLRLGKRLEKILSAPEFFTKHVDKLDALKKAGFDPSKQRLQDDWDLILKAITVYKEIYNEVRIPAKFVVPEEDPWPRVCYGLKLGVRVAAMRSAGRYVKGHPERKIALDNLGFEWRLRDQPAKSTTSDDELFDQIYNGLVAYKEVFNDLNVPLEFSIPSEEPWDEELWNIPLGELLQNLREKDKLVYGNIEREQMLSDLGYNLEESGRALFSKKRFEIIHEALVSYKNKYGDLFVPQAFIVPSCSPWPESTWGVKLGARVNAIRSQGTLVSNFPERRKILEDIGFSWELPLHIKKRKKLSDGAFDDEDEEEEKEKDITTKTEDQLEEYIGAASALSTPTPRDVVINVEQSAVDRQLELQLMKQETEEFKMRAKRQINSLSIPSRITGTFRDAITYDPSQMFEPISYREIAGEAMREYMQEREMSPDPEIRQRAYFEGHLSPEQYHTIITRTIAQEDINSMKKIGYRIIEFGRFNWIKVVEAFRIYKAHYGNIDIPFEFVINEEIVASGIGFNESFEGLNLGEIVKGLRIGDIDGYEDPERKKILKELGFIWGDKTLYQRYRFIPMILGLKLYRHLYGFALPQYNFIVPDAPQWPYWMNGMPLGEWASIARVQQQLIEEHYPDRRDILIALEFMWWIPPGPIPQKYFEPLKHWGACCTLVMARCSWRNLSH